MKQEKLNNGFLNLVAEEGFYIARKDTPLAECGEISRVLVTEAQLPDWTEVPKLAVEEAKAETERVKRYEARVVELIRQRYSADDETAILRKYLALQSQPQPFDDEKMNEIVKEFDEYNSFAEECKARAKEKLSKTE